MKRLSRIIYQEDAVEWLARQSTLEGCSFITSLPDRTEFPSFSFEEWKNWFVNAARAVLRVAPVNGVVIFYQRDSKQEEQWVDKGYLCQKAAELEGHRQLWHKIVCRVPPGNVAFGMPGFSHLLCFSKGVSLPIDRSTKDVLVSAGKSTWTRGMGMEVGEFACRFILEHTKSHTLVDPFCGHGLVLSIANDLGLNAIGVEKSRKRAERARLVQARWKKVSPLQDK